LLKVGNVLVESNFKTETEEKKKQQHLNKKRINGWRSKVKALYF